VADEVARRHHAGAVGRTLRHDLAIRPLSDRLSERLLGLQSVRLAIVVRVRRLVRARRRPANVTGTLVADHAVDLFRLSVRVALRHDDLVFPAARFSDAALARAMDVSHQQDRSGRTQVRAFSGAGGHYRALPAEGLVRIEVALAAAADPVRPAFAGDFLPRGVPGVRGAFRAGRDQRRCCAALLHQRFRDSDHVRDGVGDFVVQAFCRQECIADKGTSGNADMAGGGS
jgi:hypothetical protein